MLTYQDQLDSLEYVKAWLLAQNKRHEVFTNPLGWRIRVYDLPEQVAWRYFLGLYSILRTYNFQIRVLGYEDAKAGDVSYMWLFIQPFGTS